MTTDMFSNTTTYITSVNEPIKNKSILSIIQRKGYADVRSFTHIMR